MIPYFLNSFFSGQKLQNAWGFYNTTQASSSLLVSCRQDNLAWTSCCWNNTCFDWVLSDCSALSMPPIELSVVGRASVWLQKQLSSALTTARCGLDARRGPCTLHGVLWSNTSPPHYRSDGSLCFARTARILRISLIQMSCVLLSWFAEAGTRCQQNLLHQKGVHFTNKLLLTLT